MLYLDQPLSEKFCRKLVVRCLDSIAAEGAVNLVAMPGVGVTFFIRHLAQISTHEFVYINSFEMHEFTKSALYNQLARKLGLAPAGADNVDLQAIGEALRGRTAANKKLVLVFDRFDRLGPILDQNFYQNLLFLRDVAGERLFMLFVTSTPLIELAGIGSQDLLLDRVIYFPGYSSEDLREILVANGMRDIDDKALQLSGGHHALMQILMRCQNLDNPLSDPMPEMIIKELYFGLTPKRRKDIDAVSAGRRRQVDPFLISIGYLIDNRGKLKTFSPLLSGYAVRQGHEHLPVRERRLLSILKNNVGRVVSKQEIFDAVWRESDGIASDWALNALVYRLRRHSSFDGQRYTIESHKKRGYVLRDHLKD